jgi:hypothetical protein
VWKVKISNNSCNLKTSKKMFNHSLIWWIYIENSLRVLYHSTTIEWTDLRDVIKWTLVTQNAFNLLKKVFTSSFILLQVDLTKPFQVEIDVSFNIAIIVRLSQLNNKGVLHLITHHSNNFIALKINSHIYLKELFVNLSIKTLLN